MKPLAGYLSKVIALGLTLPKHGQYCVEVRHDAWCALLTHRGPCNCDPEIRLQSPQGGQSC